MPPYIFFLQLFRIFKNTSECEVETKNFYSHVIVGNHCRIPGYQYGKINPIMFKATFQLQPIADFSTTSDVGEIREDNLLINRSHHHIRAKPLRMLLYLLPYLFRGKCHALIKDLEPIRGLFYDTFPKAICQIEKVYFTCMHLSRESGLF